MAFNYFRSFSFAAQCKPDVRAGGQIDKKKNAIHCYICPHFRHPPAKLSLSALLCAIDGDGRVSRVRTAVKLKLRELNYESGSETDPELKGRWLIPRRQKGDFWACWDEREAAFGGVCRWPLVVFGSTGPKKIQFFFLARLGWFFCR